MQLGVSKFLEGALQRAGDRVRINVRLIGADSEALLWAESDDPVITAADFMIVALDHAKGVLTCSRVGWRRRA